MKKLLYFAPAVALLLGSCSDELTNPNATVSKEYKSKLVASYQDGNLETRTSMQSVVNGSYAYVWSPTDQIGLTQVSNVGYTDLNAAFEYEAQNVFGGQVSLPVNTEFVGYYPYSPTPLNNNNVLELQILENQVYNKKSNMTQIGTNATGSFANNAAPAVGVGTVNAQDNLDMKLYALGSYLAFPVTGYGTVGSVTLSISGLTLSGALQVKNAADFVAYAEGLVKDEEPNGAQSEIAGISYIPGNSSVTLNCGTGVELDEEIPTYFWFVIPAGLPLNGKEISITLTEAGDTSGKSQTYTRSLNTDFVGPWGNQYTQLNYVLKVTNNGAPFFYTPAGKAIIANAPQFLEYVNLVTQGVENTVNAYKSMLTNTPKQAGNSYLPGFLSTNPMTTSSAINPAYIVNNITISQDDIKDYIGQGTNLFEGALSPYFDFLQYYASNGYLAQPIGGTTAPQFVMEGVAITPETATVAEETTPAAPVYTSINGLAVKGAYVFADGTNGKTYTVRNLGFNGVTLYSTNSGAYYPFLASPANGSFNNVTLGEGCNVSYNKQVVKASNAGVFQTIYNAWYVYDVTNNSEDLGLFANTLNVNAQNEGNQNPRYGFDFTLPGRGINAFNNIVASQWGAGFAVTDKEEAVALMLKYKRPQGQNYFVFQPGTADAKGFKAPQTSFWTGTDAGNPYGLNGKSYTPAEYLYNRVNQNSENVNITLNVNLDLMSDIEDFVPTGKKAPFTPNWFVSRNQTVVIDGLANATTKATYSISNIMVNGTDQTGKNKTQLLNLFGAWAQVSNLVINNMTIDNSETEAVIYKPVDGDYGQVGALALSGPSASNVTINGLSLNLVSEDYMVYSGGFYAVMNNDLSKFTGLSISGMDATPVEDVVEYGYIAGQWNYVIGSTPLVDDTITFKNPFNSEISGYPAFAKYNLSVKTPTDLKVNYTANFIGFNSINFGQFTFEGVSNDQPTNEFPQNKYALYVYNGKKTYVFWYNVEDNEYSDSGI